MMKMQMVATGIPHPTTDYTTNQCNNYKPFAKRGIQKKNKWPATSLDNQTSTQPLPKTAEPSPLARKANHHQANNIMMMMVMKKMRMMMMMMEVMKDVFCFCR